VVVFTRQILCKLIVKPYTTCLREIQYSTPSQTSSPSFGCDRNSGRYTDGSSASIWASLSWTVERKSPRRRQSSS